MKRYKINEPQVIQESFDNEVVIVNLETGYYYSLDHVGAVVWSLIRSEAGYDEVIDTISRKFEGGSSDIENSIKQLIDEMEQEYLIVGNSIEAPIAKIELTQESTKLPFQKPILQKYSDMQELLLLDPIHEVDETGWPAAGQNSSKD